MNTIDFRGATHKDPREVDGTDPALWNQIRSVKLLYSCTCTLHIGLTQGKNDARVGDEDRRWSIQRINRRETSLRGADRRRRHPAQHPKHARGDALGGARPSRPSGARREYGLVLEAIENVPVHFYHKAMLGLAGRDEQIEHYRTTLRNMGRAGIPILGFHFMPNSVWRTERLAPGRGGAGCTKFDMALVEAKSTPDELREFLPTSLGRQEAMPLYGEGEGRHHRRADVGELRLLHQSGAARGRGGGREAGAASRRSAGADARRRRAHLLPPAGFKRAWELNPDEPRLGPRSVPRLLLGDAGGAKNVREMIEFFGPKGTDLLRPFPRRAGHRAELPGVLHRRRATTIRPR